MWWQPSNKMTDTPWISPEATRFLESLLSSDMTVCEFGGGGSTIWLSKRVKDVVTFENNPKWAKYIRDMKLDNVTVLENGMALNDSCDLLFIDGMPVELKKDWIKESINIVKKGGFIVLDNANRPEYTQEREYLLQNAVLLNRVDGNENWTLYLVTEFYTV